MVMVLLEMGEKKYTLRLNFRKCSNQNKLLYSVEHIETREDSDVSLRRRRRSSREEDGGGGGGGGGGQSMFGIPGRNQDIDCSYAAY